jgi:hypothetical protein
MAHDIGQGSFVKFSDGPIGLADFDWSGIKRADPVDISHILSTANEFLSSPTYDPGEAKLNIQWDPSLDILSSIKSQATNSVVTLVFANGGTARLGYSAFGQVQSIDGIKAARDDIMTGTITIKLSGEVGTTTTW